MVTSKKPATPETKAPAKRAASKPAAAKPAVAKAPAKKAAAPKKPAVQKTAISAEQRNHYVQVAAFYIAERRGFATANPSDDWIAAEAEIDRLIASGHFAG